MEMNNYQAYVIRPDGTELPGTLTLWKYEATREADRLKSQYNTSRVVVVNIDNRIVYEAELNSAAEV